MATRRKYRDGGRVPVVDTVVEPPVEAAPAPATNDTQNATAPAAPPAPTFADDVDPLAHALRAQMRAESLQREAAKAHGNAERPPSIDDAISALPGLSEHKRKFLRQNSHLLEPATAKQASFHYHAALQRGVPDDTEDMNRAILDGISRERQRAVQEARSIVEAPPAAPSRPRIQYSAPVSREVPSASGKRYSDADMTLTPEEVDIAHRSFVDRPDMPRLSNIDKERLYLEQRNKYRRLKASGEYSEQRQ